MLTVLMGTLLLGTEVCGIALGFAPPIRLGLLQPGDIPVPARSLFVHGLRKIAKDTFPSPATAKTILHDLTGDMIWKNIMLLKLGTQP